MDTDEDKSSPPPEKRGQGGGWGGRGQAKTNYYHKQLLLKVLYNYLTFRKFPCISLL